MLVFQYKCVNCFAIFEQQVSSCDVACLRCGREEVMRSDNTHFKKIGGCKGNGGCKSGGCGKYSGSGGGGCSGACASGGGCGCG